MTSREIELIILKLSKIKAQGQVASLVNSTKRLKEIYQELFRKK